MARLLSIFYFWIVESDHGESIHSHSSILSSQPSRSELEGEVFCISTMKSKRMYLPPDSFSTSFHDCKLIGIQTDDLMTICTFSVFRRFRNQLFWTEAVF